jgi:DNA-binding transcriptional ArsR family regulator
MQSYINSVLLSFYMPKESFVLVSLKEDKARKLARVLSNESCRRILEYLTSKEATETEIANKLGIPISTVHYNLKHLSGAGLVTVEEFHYSAKGKEVNHYKLANKYIIIAPKSTFGIKERLKSILPVALIVGASAFVIQLVRIGGGAVATFGAAQKETVMAGVPVSQATQASPVWWFLAGALFTIAVFLLLDWIKSRK